MAKRKGKKDFRDTLILLLLLIIGVETFLLISTRSKQVKTHGVSKKHLTTSDSEPKRKARGEISETKKVEGYAEKKLASAVIPPAPPSQKTMGQIAIIIDDWGYNLQHCALLEQIKSPVTVAVLPNLAHSTSVAQCAHEQGQEVMLHLPLEPHRNDEQYPENYIIKVNMTARLANRLLDEYLKDIPHVAGINNHMGSKATEDKKLMKIIFTRLKQSNLFFVDSRVTDSSICAALAGEMKIPFTQRDVFLDNTNERSYIEKQFDELADLAQRQGYAVGIGHDRALTLQIIKERTESLQKKGFKFVTIRNLLKTL